MRVVGMCTDCHRPTTVKVDGNAFALAVARGGVVEGICSNCERKRDASVTDRPLHVIADDIQAHWHKPFYGAVPYISAMRKLDTVRGAFGEDSAKSIVQRFLVNAATWRGEHARRIKAELKGMIK